jgi:hypothetical protein
MLMDPCRLETQCADQRAAASREDPARDGGQRFGPRSRAKTCPAGLRVSCRQALGTPRTRPARARDFRGVSSAFRARCRP